ncbi:MAG: hypothetical protein FWG14_08220 [Peptococcaceae bacterium]|nr:hypothetical protein [Peptococcaceae bacterium]
MNDVVKKILWPGEEYDGDLVKQVSALACETQLWELMEQYSEFTLMRGAKYVQR